MLGVPCSRTLCPLSIQETTLSMLNRSNKPMEKPILHVDKAWVFCNDNGTSSAIHHDSCYEPKELLPEIEAKSEGKDVIIKVHCENKNSYLKKVVEEIEKHHLRVENISSLPFGDHFLDITVVGKMGDEFCMTMNDMKRDLRQALLDLI